MGKPNLADYVTVPERIDLFYEKYPEGSLRCKEIRPFEIGSQNFILYIAQAFRSPDDPAPAEGVAWEPVPGKSNFTRDSEVMNCETSAWGRAIAALGFEVKRGIASREEVRRAQDSEASARPSGSHSGAGQDAAPDHPSDRKDLGGPAGAYTASEMAASIINLCAKHGLGPLLQARLRGAKVSTVEELPPKEQSELLEWLETKAGERAAA